MRSTSGAWPGRPVRPCCCASRTTTGVGRGPRSRPRSSRTSPGSGSSPTRGRFGSPTTTRPTRPHLTDLPAADLIYRCTCSRTTFAEWANDHGRPWHGPGCPGGCRRVGTDGPTLRVALGGGSERWMDELVGPCADEVAGAGGDMPIRDRDGNWTYGFAVAVDDLRQSRRPRRPRPRPARRDRGPDPARTFPRARDAPPTFAHHRLVRRPDGAKLSKADGDTSIRDLRAAGGRRPSSSARRQPRSG